MSINDNSFFIFKKKSLNDNLFSLFCIKLYKTDKNNRHVRKLFLEYL